MCADLPPQQRGRLSLRGLLILGRLASPVVSVTNPWAPLIVIIRMALVVSNSFATASGLVARLNRGLATRCRIISRTARLKSHCAAGFALARSQLVSAWVN